MQRKCIGISNQCDSNRAAQAFLRASRRSPKDQIGQVLADGVINGVKDGIGEDTSHNSSRPDWTVCSQSQIRQNVSAKRNLSASPFYVTWKRWPEIFRRVAIRSIYQHHHSVSTCLLILSLNSLLQTRSMWLYKASFERNLSCTCSFTRKIHGPTPVSDL